MANVTAFPDKATIAEQTARMQLEVEAVRFHGGAAWPVLALRDGDEVAVMAVQKADGGSASGEAQRLAQLVARHGRGALS